MQLYLDMQFVMIFSSQGRYLSRHLHQAIKNIIGRAIDAVAATGIDPMRYIYMMRLSIFLFLLLHSTNQRDLNGSVLPEDEWFVEVSEIAIKMITGKAVFDNVEEDDYSPTGFAQA